VQKLRDAGTDERHAEQVVAVGVDHHPRPPGVSVGVKFCARHDVAYFDVNGVHSVTGLLCFADR
jgi:hypothetical protein